MERNGFSPGCEMHEFGICGVLRKFKHAQMVYSHASGMGGIED